MNSKRFAASKAEMNGSDERNIKISKREMESVYMCVSNNSSCRLRLIVEWIVAWLAFFWSLVIIDLLGWEIRASLCSMYYT